MSGRPDTSSTHDESLRISAAKTELGDVNCVIASIGDMGIDWAKVACQQPDQEFRQLRNNDIGQQNLIVDKSNGPHRPYRRIFNLIHGLGYPGVERTRQAVAAKVVWPSMREDVSKWARECLDCQRAKVTNKFVYTKAQSRVIGQENLCPKIMKKMKFWTFWTFLKI